MAKIPSELNRKVLQHLRTTGDVAYVENQLSGVSAMGEIIVQLTDDVSGTSLWTLAKDGKNAVQFVNKETVEDMIKHGAVDEVNAIEAAVGLDNDGHYVSPGNETLVIGKESPLSANTIANDILALDTYLKESDYELAKNDNKVLVSVEQVNGRISATSENITSVKLDGYVEGSDADIAATDTLGEALGKLQAQINAMDKSASAVDGQVVVTVSEVDGKVSETKANVKDLQLGGYEKGNQTGAIESADTVEVALSKIENTITANKIANADGSINVTTASTGTDINVNIKSGEHVLAKDGSAGVYTDIKIDAVTGEALASLGTDVREAYQLTATDGSKLGEYIKIYKDSSLYNVALGHIGDLLSGTTDVTEESESSVIISDPTSTEEALNFVYLLSDGKYKLAQVSLESFLQEAEFKDGLQVNANHEVSVKKDASSEKVITAYSSTGNTEADVITISSDGVKIAKIQDAINAAVGKAQTVVDTTVGSEAETTSHLSISSTTADNGQVTYHFTTNDIASEDALDAEVARATSAETQLDAVIGAVKGASEARTYGHSGTNYLDSNSTVKSDAELLDTLLGAESKGDTADTVFSSGNTVAKNISDIKKDIDAFKHKLDLSVVDDNQYIATNITSSATGTVIGVSAITKSIASSTSGDSAVADSNDVREYAVNDVVAAGTMVTVDAAGVDGARKINFTYLSIDCGSF